MNMERSILLLLSLVWAAFASGMAWCVIDVIRQVTYVKLADGRLQARPLPATFRLLLPFAPNVIPLLQQPAMRKAAERIDRRLVSAGYDGLVRGEEFLALRFLEAALGLFFVAGLWMLFSLIPGKTGLSLTRHQGTLFVMTLLWFFIFPDRWLSKTLRRRHRNIQRALPYVLDLLTLSVEAGLDFMTALQRIVDRRAVDAISEEFIAVIREIQVGKTRRDSLRDMSERVDQPDVRQVINALVQADEFGVGVATILRIQADAIRNRRFERAEKMANEAPVKMLFPLVAFIFPAVFLVLLGPFLMQIATQLLF